MKLWQRHLIFSVIIYIAWSYMKTSGSFWRPIFLINILNVGIYMAAYYTLRHYQLPKLYNQKKWLLFGVSLLITSVGFYVIWRVAGILWMDDLYYRNTRDLPFWSAAQYLVQTVQFYSPAIALLAIDTYNDRQREKLRLEQLEKEKLATELKFLKAQINPHFLFNTLNNLYSFVVNQSPKAPDIILQLSGKIDYVLYQSQKNNVPLREELNCIENFLKLEQIRYGERLKIDYQTGGDLTIPISPLLLLSIVENAFKHGASGDIDEPKINIQIHADTQMIQCEVWNTKSQYQGELNDAYKEGIGLKNIKRQLDLIYPEQHELKIRDEVDSFCVNLRIMPLNI